MKAIIVSLAAALIALMLLTACGTETAVVSMPPADTEAPSDAPTETPAESGDMDTLSECLALLGMDDETAKDALGGGDIKLFFSLGLILGTGGVLLVFGLTALLSAGHFIWLLARRKLKRTDTVPMVPYIAAASCIYFVFLWGAVPLQLFL